MAPFEAVNYNHLFYFWATAHDGSIAAACERLHVSQPTVSAQIRKLENALGEKLFRREGRRLALTEAGQVVYEYADEMFALGREFVETLRGTSGSRTARLLVGVPNALPKLITFRLLEPAFRLNPPVRVVVQEANLDELMANLTLHRLDLVIADSPFTGATRSAVFNQRLGGCGMSIFAKDELAGRFRAGFPASLAEAPLLLPTRGTQLRRSLDQWFYQQGISPQVVGESEDSALLKEFGYAGIGLFPAPTATEREVCRQYGVEVVGRITAVQTEYFAVSVERRRQHPAISAIADAAREDLFGRHEV